MNFASFGKRLLAMLIDSFVVSLIGLFVVYIWGYYSYFAFSGLLGALYYILLEGSKHHATLGKKAMGLMVTDASGNGIGYAVATGRYFGRLLSYFTLGIGYLMAAFSPTVQTLHDKIAGTFVLDVTNQPATAGVTPNVTPVRNSSCIMGINGEFAGKSFPIPSSGIVMGRDMVTCQIVFRDGTQGVSRHHCHVQFNPQTGLFVLSDMGSSHGTFTMNGAKIQQGMTVALKSGERFYLGTQNVMFETRQ